MEASRGQPGQTGRFDFERLQGLAAETEITSGGAGREDGTWMITQDDLPDQSQAFAIYDRLRKAGYPAKIHPVANVIERGIDWKYPVFITGYANLDEASRAATNMQAATGTRLKPRKFAKN